MTTKPLCSLLIVIVALFGACKTSSKDAVPASATEAEWVLIELKGQPIAAANGQRQLTLKLDSATRRVTGHGGINRFSGGYVMERHALKFGLLISTKMGGSPEAMALVHCNSDNGYGMRYAIFGLSEIEAKPIGAC